MSRDRPEHPGKEDYRRRETIVQIALSFRSIPDDLGAICFRCPAVTRSHGHCGPNSASTLAFSNPRGSSSGCNVLLNTWFSNRRNTSCNPSVLAIQRLATGSDGRCYYVDCSRICASVRISTTASDSSTISAPMRDSSTSSRVTTPAIVPLAPATPKM